MKSTIGKHDEAVELARLARQLEPLSPVVNMGIPWALHFAGRQDEALIEARRVEELSPGFEEAGNVQIGCLEGLGRYEEAATIMKRQRTWDLPIDGDALLEAHRADGTHGYWCKRLELLQSMGETPTGSREYSITLSLGHLGRLDEAIQSAQRCIDVRANMCAFLNVDPNLTPLHQHPTFERLVEQIGIGR